MKIDWGIVASIFIAVFMAFLVRDWMVRRGMMDTTQPAPVIIVADSEPQTIAEYMKKNYPNS